MTLPETAAHLDVSMRTVFRYLRAGRLEAVRGVAGRRVFVRREDADSLLTARYGRRIQSD